jgi:hypothetical protein
VNIKTADKREAQSFIPYRSQPRTAPRDLRHTADFTFETGIFPLPAAVYFRCRICSPEDEVIILKKMINDTVNKTF